MNTAKVMPDLKSYGQEQFFLLWASLYPLPSPLNEPAGSSDRGPLAAGFGDLPCGSWSSYFSRVTVLPPHHFCLWEALWHIGLLFFSPLVPSMPLTQSPSFSLLIKEVPSTIWVRYFPSPRVADSQSIRRSSNHTMKRNIHIEPKENMNYSIGFLIQPPMTQQKLQFGLERGRKRGAI